MNSQECKVSSGSDYLPRIDFSPIYAPEINSAIFEANNAVYKANNDFTKMASHLEEKMGHLTGITSSLSESINQLTGIASYVGANLSTGITSCVGATIIESLTGFQVETARLIGLPTIGSLATIGYDIESAVKSAIAIYSDYESAYESAVKSATADLIGLESAIKAATTIGLGFESAYESFQSFNLCSDFTLGSLAITLVGTSGLIDLSDSKVFTSNLQNAIGSLASIQKETLSNTVSPSFSSSKLLAVRNLTPQQIETSKNHYIESIYQQEIPVHYRFKSEKIKERGKLFLEMQSIVNDQRANYSLNLKAYELLYDLEVSLRNLIRIRIIEPYRKNLSNKIPKNMLNDWKDKKLAEKPNSLEDDFDLIDYSDFTDLKTILEKGRNREEFGDIFNEGEMKVLISKLHELNPIRIKIAHSRALTMNELYRLILYSNDILARIRK